MTFITRSLTLCIYNIVSDTETLIFNEQSPTHPVE